MLKINKKITAAILTGIISSSSAVSSFAFNESVFLDDRRIKDSGTLYIKSESVPEAASGYIRDIFANLYADDLDFLGYSFKEAKEMRLSPGFCATDFETGETLENVYYFPVMCGRNFVGMFTVTYFDGEYGYSFGKSEFADSLNKLKTMPGETAEIIMNEDATYGVVGSKVELLEEAFDADKEREQDVMHAISERALLELAEKKPDELEIDSAKTPWITDGLDANIVSIGSQSLYPEKINTKEALKSGEITFIGYKRKVPILENGIRETDNGETGGFCYACCVASLYGYYNYGGGTDAQEEADELYAEFKNDNVFGTIDDAKDYLESNTSKKFIKSGSLDWKKIRIMIGTKDSPCYTSWQTADNASGHAMVLCGYRHNKDKPTTSSYYGLYFMDPNQPNYYLRSYNNGNPLYYLNGKRFYWGATLTEK